MKNSFSQNQNKSNTSKRNSKQHLGNTNENSDDDSGPKLGGNAPSSVEELSHFPFDTYNEFKHAVEEGGASVGVDRGVALDWAENGIYCPKTLSRQVTFFVFSPYLVALGYVFYAIINGQWGLLLGLPFLVIAYFVFHPSSAMTFGPIRSGLILLSFVGLGWGLIEGVSWLTTFSFALVLLYLGLHFAYKRAVHGLIGAAINNEDLLCFLWSKKLLNVALIDGGRYWADWKEEDGEMVKYQENRNKDSDNKEKM